MVYHSKRRRGEVWGGVWGEGHASSHAHPQKLKKFTLNMTDSGEIWVI